ncbi:MAG: branched-chain-amino-acid transaminase [Anaerolineae bacterium]
MTERSIFDVAVFNGRLMTLAEASISIFNPAYFASFGVYETVKVDQGRPFYLEEHLSRLLQSAAMIDLKLNIGTDALAGWFWQLARVEPQATWSLRIIALGGIEPGEKATVAMQATRLPTYPMAYYQTGAPAILFEGQRLLPTCKSLNTLVNYLARRKAQQANVLEGLLHHNGCLTEGSRTNLFAVRGGVVHTPPTGEVLSGITRDVILQVMAQAGQPVVEAPVAANLSGFEELFISSTSMHVMPITTIDGRPVGSGQVGPVTRQVMERFETHYRAYMEAAKPAN